MVGRRGVPGTPELARPLHSGHPLYRGVAEVQAPIRLNADPLLRPRKIQFPAQVGVKKAADGQGEAPGSAARAHDVQHLEFK